MVHSLVRLLTRRLAPVAIAATGIGAVVAGSPAGASVATTSTALVPLAVQAPLTAKNAPGHRDAFTYCNLPDGSSYDLYHCYTPQDIRAAYGVDSVTLPGGSPNSGAGQTIVLVDSYGSPTAAADLQHFHDTFFSGMPKPKFQQIFPLGNPQYNNTCGSKGLSGPCAAANWSGEATLDIEWAYSIAPEANIVLLAVPPAETEGIQGFPNLFKAISGEIDATPAGTVFSMSFGVTEQTFGGNPANAVKPFDAVFQKGLAKGDNFFASAGDYGSYNTAKQHKDTSNYPYPTVGWPASSPYVNSVGGTQLQYGWTWNPTSDDPSTTDYWNSTASGNTEAVWNESWAPIATGGGASIIYGKPTWQTAGSGSQRLVPDTSWNAAVNGGVDVWITAYPGYNCGSTTGCWTFFGGTSAASPQTAALVALANAERAAEKKAPVGFVAPLLYSGVGASAYKDIVPMHYGSAPATFAGSNVGVSGTVLKSAGDLEDNQLWENSVAGYPTKDGYDATTGWGTPIAPAFVAALAAS